MQKKQAKKPVHSMARKAAQQIRIIGGQWKRTPLAVVGVEGLRPTPDRVRETVFNWLNHLLDGQWGRLTCLDLFAGTGALGFEAASRGAGKVVMVESNMAALSQLETTRQKLDAQQVSILRSDALSATQKMASRSAIQTVHFDLIFLDPPFNQDWMAKLLPVCAPLLTENGLIYAELEQSLLTDTPLEWMHGWDVIRADKAGLVFYHLLRRSKSV